MRASPRVRLWTALWIVYLVWGSTYLAIKIAVRTLPPLLTAGTRFLAASAILALIAVVARRSLRVPPREALAAAGLGVALLTLGVGLVHVAETRIESGVAAMIAGSVPLQIVVLRRLARERVARATAVAALVGLVGLAFVVGPGWSAGGSEAVGLLIMLTASVSWSLGSFASRRLRLPGDPFVASAYEMLGGGAVLLAVAVAAGELGDLDSSALQPGPLAAWVYLTVMGSVIGFSAYAWLLGNAPISQVVTHQYVNPLVAVALGALILDERPGPATLVGAALIVGAVAVTASREGRATPAPRARSLRLDLRPLRREKLEQIRPGDDRDGPACLADEHGAARPGQLLEDLVDRGGHVDGREGRLHGDGDVVVQRVGVAEDPVEQAPLLERADDVRQRVRRPGAHDRQLGDAVLLEQVDRAPDLLVGLDHDELRDAALLRSAGNGSPRRPSARERAAP